MSATIATERQVACPSWCDNSDCRGEHGATIGDGPVPATGSLPRFSSAGGVYYPTITVGLSWDTIDHLEPTVSLWIASEGEDTQADLKLHEAKELLVELGRAVATLEAHR